MYLLGFDIGSSSVKVSLIESESGKCEASAYYPKQEMKITAAKAGWAEQDPQLWWENTKLALAEVMRTSCISASDIKAIGISYQMHGLVAVDKNKNPLRPAIIWCDSRAAEIGNKALNEIGSDKCLSHLLNSPGNFTASKLKWVKDNEPEIFEKIYKIMLPGDYIAMKLTGEINTTIGGLSEGMFWDFKNNATAQFLLDYYGFSSDILPEIVPTFSIQGELTQKAADELGLVPGIKISYRAGDQPNNALSLNVLNPGEIAATGGTSGVVYGVSEEVKFDPLSRVNTFAHVNHTTELNRLGILLCINGTGILNSWLNKQVAGGVVKYPEMDKIAAGVPIGSEGLSIMPFGNGAERVLQNENPGAAVMNLNFNIHKAAHMYRAGQEGIAFSFKYGMDIMKGIGIHSKVIRAGKANMFFSPVFRNTLATTTGTAIELFNTDGSIGAARGAGIGAGIYKSAEEAFSNLKKVEVTEPDLKNEQAYIDAYNVWKEDLHKLLGK
ncbi:MAG: carbohydrate kinase [Bacteroidales bacterium]|jgi:xylulokinase|nr:carbohydrate kinase [Bacteroidales bacterium]